MKRRINEMLNPIYHAAGAACGFAASGLGITMVPELFGAQFTDRRVVLRPLAERI